ncbi:MAG: hypothetical protein JSV47_09155 [Deltaproteobacteria bacterium]|nr:MAG: hypothetical protein JSV47_09155 [Deltaproteobacteria bacterium]
MTKRNFSYDRLLNVCLKLQTLRDSCSGMFRTQTYPPHINWFDAAAAICQEAIDWIEEILLVLTKYGEKAVTDQDNGGAEP